MKPLDLLRPCLRALLAVGALAAASTASHAGVTGSGTLRTETRAVSGFQAVALQGSMTLRLRQGTREGLELRGDDNILPLVEARVVDRHGTPTLELGIKNATGYSTRHEIVATVDLITLRALSIKGSGDASMDALNSPALALAISGSGDIRIRQLSVGELSANVAGSGDLDLAGRTGKLSVSISGSGDANTRALEADDVSVSIAGSGDASVTARKTLAVSIAGAGEVRYAGEAVVKSAIAGRGSVTKQ